MVSFRSGRRARAAATRTATSTAALADYESALQAARSLWLASDRVRRSELSAFARSLDLTDRYPGLQGIGWRPLVTHRELPAFLARTRAGGEPGFTIRPPAGVLRDRVQLPEDPNRRAWDEELPRELARAARPGPTVGRLTRPVAAGMADPLPMLTLFDKRIQLRMGQANARRWLEHLPSGPDPSP
jgi:CHASE domain